MFSKRVLFQKPNFKELKKDYALVDMHVHSKYSHDCVTPVKSLLRKARKLGIGFAITDHLRAEGSLEACKQKRILVIPGVEIASLENKEILLYFYSAKDLKDYYEKYIKNKLVIHKQPRTTITKTMRAIRSRMKMNEIIEKADNYNCLKSIPHPYTYLNRSSYLFFARKKRRDLLKRIDGVEVFNAAQRHFMNKRALKWAVKRKKAFTGGSDAHSIKEFGSAVVASKADSVEAFLDSIKKKKNFVIGKEIKFPRVVRITFKALGYKRKKGWSEVNNL